MALSALAALEQEVREVETRAIEAERKASEAEAASKDAIAEAEKLRAERDAHWKTQIDEAKKLHPGQVKLLKMYAASTREEWEEAAKFFEMFSGHLPVALVRISEGTNALLNGPEPPKKAEAAKAATGKKK